MDERALTLWRQQEVGFIFQSFGLMPTLSAYENVELMLRIARVPRKERKSRALQCLEQVGLSKWADHRPYEMSGGQQQRVAIARAIANRPRLILADEATGELDFETANAILDLFRTIVKENHLTILLASHDNLVDQYADRVLQLADGQITGAGNSSTDYAD
jgi:ABC-type lipoprotein export system ATPase subunit